MTVQLPISEWGEEVLREVFRHTPVGVVLTDLHGQILDANDAICTMLGADPAEVPGSHVSRFMSEEDAPRVESVLRRLREGDVGSVEVTRTLIHRSGSPIPAKVTVSVVRSRTNEPICGLALVENVEYRVRAEQALRDSEAAYRQVIEDQTEMIVRGRPDGTRLFVNDAYCRFMGRSREDLMQESYLPAIHNEDRAAVLQGIAQLTPSAAVHTGDHRMIRHDGAVRWQRWTTRGVFGEQSDLLEVQAVGRDITEEREALERLQRSEENFRRLFSALPAAAWETDFTVVLQDLERLGVDTPAKVIALIENDPDIFPALAERAELVTANAAAYALTGATDPQGIKRWILARYRGEAGLLYIRGAGGLILGDETVVDIELPLQNADGSRVDLLMRLARLPDWQSAHRLMAIVFDVTARRRMERDLVHRTQILEEAEIMAKIGSWECDPATDQIYGSAGFWRILDGGSSARFGSVDECVHCFHRDDQPGIRKSLDVLMREGHKFDGDQNDNRIVHPDGTVLVTRGVAFAETSPEGRVTRVYGVIQDVTDQRRAEQAAQREREALTRADKMISLGVLVAGVAHEINNPNHYITLNAPLLRDAWRDAAVVLEEHATAEPSWKVANLPWDEMRQEVPAIIDEIALGADRIAAVVAELRRFGRDHDPGFRKLLFINDVVTGSMRLLASHIKKATADFSLDLAPDLPPVLGNAQRLQQVVVNLVLNACQSLPTTGCAIQIATLRTEDRILLRITDQGSGIPAAILDKITDPFFTTKRAAGGTGLGLAVSDRIVKEHDGELTFDSRLGEGTRVTVSLPMAQKS